LDLAGPIRERPYFIYDFNAYSAMPLLFTPAEPVVSGIK